MESPVFNEMRVGITSLSTLSVFTGLVPSVDSQIHRWLRSLSEGPTILIILIETLSSMNPLMANEMRALIVALSHLLHLPSDVMYVPSDCYVIQQNWRTD